jgi:hypothetical protein
MHAADGKIERPPPRRGSGVTRDAMCVRVKRAGRNLYNTSQFDVDYAEDVAAHSQTKRWNLRGSLLRR